MTRPLTSLLRALIAAVAIIPCLIVLLPAFVIAAVMFALASAVRAVARLLEPAFLEWTELIEYDSALGWKPRPRLDAHYMALGDDVFRIVTDEEGWPGRGRLDDSDVVVIGDSFAFGYGVDANQSFTEAPGQLKVKGVGAPGYSMVHGVLLMEQFARRLNGKLVVWLPFLDNDLQDNLAPEMRGYRAPFVRPGRGLGERENWEIVAKHIQPEPWRSSDLDSRRLLPNFCVPGPLADRAFSACDYLIGRAGAFCQTVGATLVVVTVPQAMQLTPEGRTTLAALSGDPDRCDADLPDRRIADSCRRHGVPLVVGKGYWSRRDYKRREAIHWNTQGHRRMAALIERLHTSFRSGTLDELVPKTSVVQRNVRATPGPLAQVHRAQSAADRAAAGR